MTLVARAVADLQLVAEWWSGLTELRDPTAFAPRPASLLSPVARAERDHQARLERIERIDIMPGEHRDAARAAILDLLVEIMGQAWDLAETVACVLDLPTPRPPRSWFDDPSEYLALTIRDLRAAHAVDDRTGPWVAGQARRMLTEISRALCLTYTDQTLDVRCPWCQTEKAWRVRDLLAALDCRHGHTDRALCARCDQQVAIVCESGICEPPMGRVGTWWHGRPAWPVDQWGWLAKLLTAADDRENAR